MRIRKRPKIPISTSDLETQTTHPTHVVEGSSVSSTDAPPPVATGVGGVLQLDGDLLPKSSGCNKDGSVYPPDHRVGGGDLPLLIPTQMEGIHLKLLKAGEEEVADAQKAGFFFGSHGFNNNSNSSDAESSFLVKKKRGAMEVGEKKNSTKTKYSTTNGSHENGAEEKKGSKRKSPAVLMEGSRCSRVNGRGWRCCQQTLVGYSLCEHHLGKGRLQSVNRNTSTVKFKNNTKKEEEDEMKVVISGRMRKIGIVKARSISSLLDQTNSDVNNVIIPPKNEVQVAVAATTGRTDQVSSSMEVGSASMVV